MSAIYELIGRLFVAYLGRRYRRQLSVAAALGVGTILLGGYLAAKREPPEG
jgi:hypothetical protein